MIACAVGQITGTGLLSPRRHEGRLRDRHVTWRGLRWTRQSQAHVRAGRKCAAYGEVVWSWRRDPGVQPSGLCWMGNGDNKGRSPGRVRISRQTIARGKSGCLGCTCLIRVRFLSTIAHGAAGAVSARLSLRPLSERGTTNWQSSDKSCRENEEAHSVVVPAKAGTHTPRRVWSRRTG